MNGKIAIVIPIYKEEPDRFETMSLERVSKVFCAWDIWIAAPFGINLDRYKSIFYEVSVLEKRFEPEFFAGFSGYNKMMLSASFYESFLDYEWMLICQSDVLVLEDRLSEFAAEDYDYFGAPILKVFDGKVGLAAGNGGFSLRRIQRTIDVLRNHKEEAQSWRYNEDNFFSTMGEKYPNDYRLCPIKTGAEFAFDTFHDAQFKLTGRMPMAIHGWYKGDTSFVRERLSEVLPAECKLEKNRDFSNALREIKAHFGKNPLNIIYGAGDGAVLAVDLALKTGVNLAGIVVSDGQSHPDNLNGIPVCCISEYDRNSDKTGVFIAINKEYREYPDFAGMLRKKGFSDILWMDNLMYQAMGEAALDFRLSAMQTLDYRQYKL